MDDAQLKTTTALINGGYPLHSFEDVQSLYEVYISNQNDRDKIKKAYDYILEKHKINKVKVLITVPIKVPLIASLAFPIAWSDAVSGAWI